MAQATALKVQFTAEWMHELAHCPETGDVEPELCEYRTKAFETMEAAAKYACEHNCYGSEGFVRVQEWAVNQAIYEDLGRKFWGWLDVERHLAQDGVVVEQVN
jgi:hypothetical protein